MLPTCSAQYVPADIPCSVHNNERGAYLKTEASSTDYAQDDLTDTRDDSNDNGGSLLIDDRSESALSNYD